jgi:hypothetical protein
MDICAETGLEWLNEPCPTYTACKACVGEDDPLCEGLDARCAGPCDPDQRPASSEGCSFVATKLMFVYPGHQGTHSVFVGNNDLEGRDATVDFYRIEEGTRDEILEDTQVLAPGEVHQFTMTQDAIMTGSSLLRTGGIYRVKSDLPVTAVQMAPHPPENRQPDSSLLLPEEAERNDFVVPGAPSQGQLTPNYESWSGYATIIALEDDTVVEWSIAHTELFGNGAPVPAAAAGETVSVMMNRYDNMRIAAGKDETVPRWENWDISGLVIHSSKPISVFSGSPCGVYPDTSRTCDHMQEQVFPLTYWGQDYIGPSVVDREIADMMPPFVPPAPPEQRTYWRVFAGADDTTITVTPPVPEHPENMAGTGSEIHLDKRGDYELFSSDLGTHVQITGNRAFLPVRFDQSWRGGGTVFEDDGVTINENGTPDAWEHTLGGDPSMCQMVPTEQWLDDYTFLITGRYDREFIQVMRRVGDADITVEGPGGSEVLTGFEQVGDFEVLTHLLDAGTEADYRVTSEDHFGLLQTGDNISPIPVDDKIATASYCHPGGIRIVDIFAP